MEIDPAYGGFTYKSIKLKYRPLCHALPDIYADITLPDEKPPSKLFLTMNRVTRPHRRMVVCFLQACGLLDRSLVSFRDDKPQDTHFSNPRLQRAWEEVQKKQPLVIDRDLSLDEPQYMRSNFDVTGISEAWPYRDTFFSIVCETEFSLPVLFLTEKIWKPLLCGHPFILVGTPGSMAYLNSLGFKTYSPSINEVYDLVPEEHKRMLLIFTAIKALGRLNEQELREVHNRLKPIAQYNIKHLLEMVTPLHAVFNEIAAGLRQNTEADVSRIYA